MLSYSGIYTITHLTSGRYYIGCTRSTFSKRWREHRWALRADRHKNPRLVEMYTADGMEGLKFEILCVTEPHLAHELESDLIERHISNPLCINIVSKSVANSHRPEVRAKISAKLKGRVVSEERKEKQRRSMLGKKSWTNESYLKRQKKIENGAYDEYWASKKGQPLSEEHRDKLSEAGKKAWSNPDVREKMIRAQCKTYNGIKSPDGTVYDGVTNLQEFCIEHGLRRNSLYRVMDGTRKSYKGWTRA